MIKDPIVQEALENLDHETDRRIEDDMYTIKPIARLYSDYKEKFGIPRQSGLITELKQLIVLEPEFSNPDALRGLEGFSNIWLIWGFSETRIDMEADDIKWLPTVRPPRLGGKIRKGVWATRSPYRPNSLGLSCVKVEAVEAPYIVVSGADLMNGTPIYDIKPYLADSESKPEAKNGFISDIERMNRESSEDEKKNIGRDPHLEVCFPKELLDEMPQSKRAGLMRILSLDPRGAYEKKEGYTYGLAFSDYDIKFYVENDKVYVTQIEHINDRSDRDHQ